jgi:hypothetical protein
MLWTLLDAAQLDAEKHVLQNGSACPLEGDNARPVTTQRRNVQRFLPRSKLHLPSRLRTSNGYERKLEGVPAVLEAPPT